MLKFKSQQAVEHTQRITRSLQSLTMKELNQVFDEYDLCNALISNLGNISAKLLELNPDAVQVLISSVKTVDQENMKAAM